MTPFEPDELVFVPLTQHEWPQAERIYAAGIATGHATFEAAPPTWAAFDASRSREHRLAAVDVTGRVLGWAAVSPVSDRVVYAGVVEHSIYVDPAVHGRGLGRALLGELVASTEAGGIWTIQSAVFPENASSLALHASAGFRVLGTRERVGLMSYGPRAGTWRDAVVVERRSLVVGT